MNIHPATWETGAVDHSKWQQVVKKGIEEIISNWGEETVQKTHINTSAIITKFGFHLQKPEQNLLLQDWTLRTIQIPQLHNKRTSPWCSTLFVSWNRRIFTPTLSDSRLHSHFQLTKILPTVLAKLNPSTNSAPVLQFVRRLSGDDSYVFQNDMVQI